MALKIKNKTMQFGGQLGGKTLLIVFLVVSLVLVVAYSREGEDGPLHSLQNTTSAVTSPLSGAGATVGSLAASASMSVEDLTASDASLNQLRENNERLAQMVVELEEYRLEAQCLEALVNLSDAYAFSSVSARVVGYSADSYNKVITLDVGSNAGVVSGLPVMGSTGVIGQVISVTPLTCQVRLLTDAQSGVSVLIQSSRAEGILTGSVEGVLYLEGIDSSVEVKQGDAIITSGLGGGYYRGLVVGLVSHVEQYPGDATRTIIVTPNASFNNLSEVLVVLGMSNEGAASSDSASASAVLNAVNPDKLNNTKSSSNQSNGNSSDAQTDTSQSNDSSSGGEQ